MQDWLATRVNASPQNKAIITPEGTCWSYDDLNRQTAVLCGYLVKLGLGQGDRIGVLMPNSLYYVALVHAAMRMQLVLVPLNIRLSVEELQYQIEHTECSAVFCSAETISTAKKLTGCAQYTLEHDGVADIPALWSTKPAEPVWLAEIDLDAPFAIIHTSGTSGKPKGAILTLSNFFYSATASAYRLGVLPNDIWLCVLPLYHVGGLSIVLRSVLYGTAIELHTRFELNQVEKALQERQISLISLVPTMLYRLLHEKRSAWTESLRLVLLGGAAPSEELLSLAKSHNVPFATTYGLTEATSQVATLPPDKALLKSGSVGRPLLWTEVTIQNTDGERCADGEIGEIIVRSPTVMQGYYQDPVATAQAINNSWLHTGDMGYIDADGDLWVVQRRSDLIVTGGENVYPSEVEAVLRQHPAVKDVCVVGVPDAEWGQRVVAMVVIKDGRHVTVTDLVAFSRQHLAGYKQPRFIKFVDELPQTASGKVHRSRIQELLS